MKPYYCTTIVAVLVASLTLTACARVLDRTEVIVVDGVEYTVRIYRFEGLVPVRENHYQYVVVIDGSAYNCAPDPTVPPDCDQTVRQYLAYLAGTASEPPLTHSEMVRLNASVPEGEDAQQTTARPETALDYTPQGGDDDSGGDAGGT